jgi:hypothetical protein
VAIGAKTGGEENKLIPTVLRGLRPNNGIS